MTSIHSLVSKLCSLLSFILRCYLQSGDIDRGLKTFDDYMKSGNLPAIELYTVSLEINTIFVS